MNTQLVERDAKLQIEEFSGDNESELVKELAKLFGSSGYLFYRPEWRRIFNVYGLTYRLWTARKDNLLIGVLPVVEQRSPLTGRQLVSLPWLDAAGLVLSDRRFERHLVEHVEQAARDVGLGVVQLRQRLPMQSARNVRMDKVLMRMRLDKDSVALWKRLDPKVRNQVRKSEKGGVTVEFGGREMLRPFFQIYSENMRDLGSPSHSFAFFQAIVETFPNEACIAVASAGNKPVGAGLTLANGGSLEIPWASSLRRYNSLCVNHGMYWKILERACIQGFDWFHFGRSSIDSGTFHFKKQWGAEPEQLYWYFLGDEKLAKQAANPSGNDHGLAVKVWRRLPLFITRAIGPRLISQIP